MERLSIWVIIVVLLLGVLFLREPRFQRSEETFLRWLIRHSQPAVKAVPITIVETGRENPPSPLETALLLQGALEFKPTVIAIEPVLNSSAPCRSEAVSSGEGERKSTRLNASHLGISHSGFCLIKKTGYQ